MIDEKRIKRFIEGAKKAYKEVDDLTFTFPMNILSAYELATSIEELLKAQEAKQVFPIGYVGTSDSQYATCPWCFSRIHSNESQHYCGHCGRLVKWE